MDAAPIPVETLLAHREWVRAVARAVVRDPNAADDVEQETWVAALSSPPRHESSLRGWFGAVTRSRARRIGRTAARRGARELEAARREATPSAADLAEIADTHRRVVQAVVELDEPYREAVLLRYFEGLAVEAVAARTGAPVATARSRIRRGVAKLRERLSEEFGEDDRPWELALVPLIGRPHVATGGAAGAVGGGLLMASTTKSAVAVATVLLLIGGGAVVAARWNTNDTKVVAAAADAAPTPNPVAREDKPTPVPRPPRQRAEDPAPPVPKPEDPKPTAPDETVLQRLQRTKMTADWNQTPFVDVMGELTARSGVEIVLAQEAVDLLGKDAAIERLSLDQEAGANQLLDLVTQLKGVKWTIEEPRVVIVPPDGKRDPSLPVVVPPKWTPPGPIDVTGRVTDATGGYVAGAEIVQVRRGVRTVATTDNGGHYDARLEWPYGSIEARTAGQIRSFTASVSGTPGSKVTLDFALRGPAGSLAVRVIDDAGPLKAVLVRLYPELPHAKSEADAARQQDQVTAMTGDDGTVVFPSVEPGVVEIYATLKDYEGVRGGARVEVGGRGEVVIRMARKVALGDKLDKQHISFNFSGSRLPDVVKFINDAKQMNVIIDPAISERLRTFDLSLEVKDVPVREALRALCDRIGGLTFDVHEKEEIVWIHAVR